jgi:DNA (cytosine-5)-methyltransferase 1
MMRHGSLFNGIGGFQLAAAWMGWENVMSCEIDEFCNKVTKHHFPNCIQHGNIKTTDLSIYRGQLDIVSGGFPCQPFSVAGDQTGEKHEQYLLEEMLRASFQIMPPWIVAENVPGITSRKFKFIFSFIYSSLEAKGYTVQPFNIPASAVEAPHERQRIWFVAYSHAARKWRDEWKKENEINVTYSSDAGIEGLRQERENTIHGSESFTNTDSNKRCKRRMHSPEPEKTKRYAGAFDSRHDRNIWQDFPTQPPLCGRNDGVSNRVDRIKALGNAIVPQVAYEIFKTIEQFELKINL